MTARETILGDIRRQLGRNSSAPPAAPPVRLRIPEVSRARRIESMLERVAALAGKAFHARSAQEAIDYVKSVTQGRPWVELKRAHSCGNSASPPASPTQPNFAAPVPLPASASPAPTMRLPIPVRSS